MLIVSGFVVLRMNSTSHVGKVLFRVVADYKD